MTETTKMTLQQTLSNFFTVNESAADCFMQGYATDESVELMDKKRIVYDEVDSYGGEDQGSTYYRVYCFQSDSEKVYIKFNGWYASHYGTEYQVFEIVIPQQRTITVYE